jgi:hypothetical protein
MAHTPASPRVNSVEASERALVSYRHRISVAETSANGRMVMNDDLASVWIMSKEYCKIYLEEKKTPNCSKDDVRFEVFTAVTMKNSIFCDVTPCGSRKNRRFGGT